MCACLFVSQCVLCDWVFRVRDIESVRDGFSNIGKNGIWNELGLRTGLRVGLGLSY